LQKIYKGRWDASYREHVHTQSAKRFCKYFSYNKECRLKTENITENKYRAIIL
jgi:hypothetical protein